MRVARLALGLLAVVFALACGVSPGAPEILPGGVVTPAVPPPPEVAATGPSASLRPARIFLVTGGQLIDVPRSMPAPGLEGTLRLLLEGPTAAEISAGVRSAIAAGTQLRSATLEAGIAVVDLSRAFLDLGGEEQILAVAQLVLTATAVAGVDSVRFALDGEDLEVPRADGTLVGGPLTAGDYAPLRAGAGPR
ncbi:MAG: GerMN domain-containing protein [Acidimicrobiia bacterium]